MLMLTDRVDDELLDAAGPQLRIVADYAVGIDNVDLEACRAARCRRLEHAGRPDRDDRRADDRDRARAAAAGGRGRPLDPPRRGVDLGAEPDARAEDSPGSRSAWSATAGSVGGRAVGRCPRDGRGPQHPRRAGSRSTSCSPTADVVSLHLPLTDESTAPDRRGRARADEAGGRARQRQPRADRRRGGARRGAAGGAESPAPPWTCSSASRRCTRACSSSRTSSSSPTSARRRRRRARRWGCSASRRCGRCCSTAPCRRTPV